MNWKDSRYFSRKNYRKVSYINGLEICHPSLVCAFGLLNVLYWFFSHLYYDFFWGKRGICKWRPQRWQMCVDSPMLPQNMQLGWCSLLVSESIAASLSVCHCWVFSWSHQEAHSAFSPFVFIYWQLPQDWDSISISSKMKVETVSFQ